MGKHIRLLIIEDVESDAALVLRHLKRSDLELEFVRVQTREDMREALRGQRWDMILCDYKMPRFSAPEALGTLQETGLDIPFIVVSGTVGEDIAVECLRSGAADFVSKDNLTRLAPAINRELQEAATRRARRMAEKEVQQSRVSARSIVAASKDGMIVVDRYGVVQFANPAASALLARKEDTLEGTPLGLPITEGEVSELEIPRANGDYAVVEMSAIKIQWAGEQRFLVTLHDVTLRKNAELTMKEGYLNLADTLARSMASRDPYTTNHQRRVAEFVTLVGDKMKLPEDRLWNLRLGGLLHDIGKIAIPEVLLTKPGTLAPEELELVRTHVQEGYEILRDAGLPEIVSLMVLHHHERIDGTGYPSGLAGDSLGLEDRILIVCNAAESMGSFRPYRRAASLEEVVDAVRAGRGGKYDADTADCVVELLRTGEFVLGI